jgi:surfeit locus 1 family protein
MSKQNLWLPTFMTLLGIAILCGLGYWQLERAEWKRNLVAELDAEYSKDASQTILDLKQPDLEFSRGSLEGQYDFGKQIFIGPRTYTNLPGRHVFTPFILTDGTIVLVNRGWVPNEWKFADEQNRDALQTGKVTGLVRKPDRHPFAPENRPELDQWYYPDIEQFEQAKKVGAVQPYILMLEAQEIESGYPVAAATKPQLPNDHLQYAIFWFTMAGILAIIFVLRFLRK